MWEDSWERPLESVAKQTLTWGCVFPSIPPSSDEQTRDRAGLVLTEGQALPGLKIFRIIAMIPAMRGSGGAWPSVRTREPSRGDDRLSRRRVDA